jgi:hypothetical protein
MLSALAVAQYLMLIPIAVGLPRRNFYHFLADVGVLAAVVIAIRFRGSRIARRRTILEDELLSIHSCAIVWQAVVICHYESLAPKLEHYTERLARVAQELATEPLDIHGWLTRPRDISPTSNALHAAVEAVIGSGNPAPGPRESV